MEFVKSIASGHPRRELLLSFTVVSLLLSSAIAIKSFVGWQAVTAAPPTGVVRTYYIAADEVEWDYAPFNINNITGEPFGDKENVFVQSGKDRIGKVYLKALYREYTDATFRTLKPRPREWQHLGSLGPVIRAVVGDTIKVVFKNNARFPFSVHPHGVFYLKDSEGAPYNDGTRGADKHDDAVEPGDTHTYIWPVPARAGPGPGDPSSILWMYHSHVDEPACLGHCKILDTPSSQSTILPLFWLFCKNIKYPKA